MCVYSVCVWGGYIYACAGMCVDRPISCVGRPMCVKYVRLFLFLFNFTLYTLKIG